MRPVRKIRRVLAEIEHNSARSTRTVWSTLMGWNLFLSVPLAIPCALLLDGIVTRQIEIATATGRLFRQDDGSLSGVGMELGSSVVGWQQLRPYGEYSVTLETVARGWPAASHDSQPMARVEVSVIDPTPESREKHRAAVAWVLRNDPRTKGSADRKAMLVSLESPERGPTIVWWALAFNTLVCMPVLYAIGSLLVGVAWVCTSLVQQQVKAVRRARRRKGLCPRCSHRVDGNLWSGHCPECGEPLY